MCPLFLLLLAAIKEKSITPNGSGVLLVTQCAFAYVCGTIVYQLGSLFTGGIIWNRNNSGPRLS